MDEDVFSGRWCLHCGLEGRLKNYVKPSPNGFIEAVTSHHDAWIPWISTLCLVQCCDLQSVECLREVDLSVGLPWLQLRVLSLQARASRNGLMVNAMSLYPVLRTQLCSNEKNEKRARQGKRG
jgi:hypothetical protein